MREPPAIGRAVLLCVALRAAVALLSVGTNDVELWHQFGREAAASFYSPWLSDNWMNHPPLPVLVASLCYRLAGGSLYGFGLLLKLPAIAGEAISTLLIARIVAGRFGSLAGRRAALLFAVNPTGLVVSGYHGNVDPFLAMLMLLAWYCAARGRGAVAGAGLGAAINVKIVPTPSALLLLATSRSIGEAAWRAVPLLLWSLPFAWMVYRVGRPFADAVFAYKPGGWFWITVLPDAFAGYTGPGPVLYWLVEIHKATMLSIGTAWLVVVALRRSRHDPIELAALYWCGLLWWTGGTHQYAVWPLPLLAATRPRWALAYGCAAGVWLAASYAEAWTGTFPPVTKFDVTTEHHARFLMELPMLALLGATVSLWRGRRYSRDMEPMKPMQPMKPLQPMKPMKPMEPMKFPAPWWPTSYGPADSAGGQNGVRYAYFAAKRRLIVERGGSIREYDTGDHAISGVQQAQGGDLAHLVFTSQHGPVALESLRAVD